MQRIVAILPVGKRFDRVYEEAIRPGAEEIRAEVHRVVPEFSTPGRLGEICKEVEKSESVIADISARNPSVLFLAGYAMGVGRPVLFAAQHGEDFPFDRGKHAPIIYANDLAFLRNELIAHLRGEAASSTAATGVAREQFMATFGDLLKRHGHEHHGDIYLENATTYVLVNQDMDLPLVQDLARRGRELGIRIKLM